MLEENDSDNDGGGSGISHLQRSFWKQGGLVDYDPER